MANFAHTAAFWGTPSADSPKAKLTPHGHLPEKKAHFAISN